MITRKTEVIGAPERGIRLTTLTDPKFKTSEIRVHFVYPMNGSTASADSFTAYILEDTNSDYPDITKFNNRLAQLYGAHINCSNNRIGDHRYTCFAGSIISDKYALEGEQLAKELLQMIFGNIFSPVLENGTFPAKQFELKRQELSDDILADINDKRSYAIKQAAKLAFEGEPCADPIKGETEDAKALTPETAYKAYINMLETARVEIFFAGAEEPAGLAQVIEEAFAPVERHDICSYTKTLSPVKASPVRKEQEMDVVQSKMVMYFKYGEDYSDKKEIVKMFNAVYSGSTVSLLFKNVREKMSLCYYCAGSPSISKGVYSVDSGLEAANAEVAEKEILHQLDMVKNGEFTDELVVQAKNYMLTALTATEDFPGSVIGWYFNQFDCDDPVSPSESIQRTLAVTKEQIMELAQHMTLDTVYLLKGVQK